MGELFFLFFIILYMDTVIDKMVHRITNVMRIYTRQILFPRVKFNVKWLQAISRTASSNSNTNVSFL